MSELDYEQYHQKGGTYVIPVEVFNELLEENQKLNKQLEEYQFQNIDLRADIMIQKKAFPNKLIKDKTFYDLYDMPTYEDLLHQQKEFIEYLENEIYSFELRGTSPEYNFENVLKRILLKYKEIVGGDR